MEGWFIHDDLMFMMNKLNMRMKEHMFNWNMERPPGIFPVQPQYYMALVLAKYLETLVNDDLTGRARGAAVDGV